MASNVSSLGPSKPRGSVLGATGGSSIGASPVGSFGTTPPPGYVYTSAAVAPSNPSGFLSAPGMPAFGSQGWETASQNFHGTGSWLDPSHRASVFPGPLQLAGAGQQGTGYGGAPPVYAPGQTVPDGWSYVPAEGYGGSPQAGLGGTPTPQTTALRRLAQGQRLGT